MRNGSANLAICHKNFVWIKFIKFLAVLSEQLFYRFLVIMATGNARTKKVIENLLSANWQQKCLHFHQQKIKDNKEDYVKKHVYLI